MNYKSFFLILIFSFLSSPLNANLKDQFNKETNKELDRENSCKILFKNGQYIGDIGDVDGSLFRFFVDPNTKNVFKTLNNGYRCGISYVGIVGKNGKYNYRKHTIDLYGDPIDRTDENCYITTFYDIEDGDLIEYKSDKCSAIDKSKEIIKTRFSGI